MKLSFSFGKVDEAACLTQHTHTHTQSEKNTAAMQLRICKYVEKIKSANMQRGSERGKQSFNVGEKQRMKHTMQNHPE